jgi:hypothetical protein
MVHHSFIKPAVKPRPLWQVSFTRADREGFVENFINSVGAKLTATPEFIKLQKSFDQKLDKIRSAYSQ